MTTTRDTPQNTTRTWSLCARGATLGGKRAEVWRVSDDTLDAPLHWRKPRRIFVNSMSDLFHEAVPFEFVDRVFAVMALCPQHTFQILTKRPERMAEYSAEPGRKYAVHAALERMCSTLDDGSVPAKLDPLNGRKFVVPRRLWAQAPAYPTGMPSPLPNVWLGTSVEDQPRADERIPHLLRCPAAVRFLSCEPLLGAVDLSASVIKRRLGDPQPDWVIVGGESGPHARPCNVAWVRSIVVQCKAAGVACFVKQLGARVTCRNDEVSDWMDQPGGPCLDDISTEGVVMQGDPVRVLLRDRKGGEPSEWTEDLRVREMPR